MTDIVENCQRSVDISRCLQLAILLEVSAAKPGNVSFAAGFEGTCKEHFLASAIAVGPVFQEAVKRGMQIANGERDVSAAGLGELVELGVREFMEWQYGGNTILGTVMLFMPIAIAAGMSSIDESVHGEGGGIVGDLKFLRGAIKEVICNSTAMDSVHLYDAIDVAMPSGLNHAPNLSVNDPTSRQRLITENVTLYQVFDIAKDYDDICSEWVRNYPITFDEAYPYLSGQLGKVDQNSAVVNTFLKILADHPDTFIARKAGAEKAKEISVEAKKVLALGGATTVEGKAAIEKLDYNLRSAGNHYNPGTTADLTATTLSLCTLNGYRP
ncbi:MAG: triphosphoribosyl-dephospho-CoA synthase [Nitrososphaerota archaeon]|jgi:triphosphoribosyl-dephospho-CoA synthase|nr:triphosphoribosyl-dephospho-CoA synthase [Nitrososphaerota archaeon]